MEELPDELKEKFKEIDKKVYPPDEEYLKFKAEIDGWIEWRNRLAREIKYIPARNQSMKRLQLAEFDNKIAQGKKALKTFYEACQQGEREKEKEALREKHIDEALERAERASEKLYIIIKHQKPHLFEEFHHICTQDLTPEELKDFYRRIEHLEATQLNDILEGKE